MKTRLSLAEYDRLSAQVRAAWVQLNQAGDTPDSRRSILCLQSALDDVLGAAEELHGSADLEETVARHPGFRLRRPDAAGIAVVIRLKSDCTFFIHRVNGVVDEIDEHPLDLLGVEPDLDPLRKAVETELSP